MELMEWCERPSGPLETRLSATRNTAVGRLVGRVTHSFYMSHILAISHILALLRELTYISYRNIMALQFVSVQHDANMLAIPI